MAVAQKATNGVLHNRNMRKESQFANKDLKSAQKSLSLSPTLVRPDGKPSLERAIGQTKLYSVPNLRVLRAPLPSPEKRAKLKANNFDFSRRFDQEAVKSYQPLQHSPTCGKRIYATPQRIYCQRHFCCCGICY